MNEVNPTLIGFAPLKQFIINQVEQQQADYVAQEVLVRFKDHTTDTEIQQFLSDNNLIIKEHLVDHLYLMSILSQQPMQELLINVNHSPIVAFAEPNYLPHDDNHSLPTDSEFPQQWGLYNTGQNGGTPGVDINVIPAWQLTKGSPEVVVAVNDSGADPNHIDLQDNLVLGWNFNTESGNTADTLGHGTQVSGVIVAAENGIGVVGVAPQAKVMPLPRAGINTIVRAINFADQHGIRIFNMSFSIPVHVESLREVMAARPHILFVCSAGNDGHDRDVRLQSPASFNLDNQLTVAMITRMGHLDPTSDYGQTTVHLAAPGTDIRTTSLNNTFTTITGTSFSAPMVAGVAALIYSIRPHLTTQQVRALILNTVTKMPTLAGRVASSGTLNAGNALIAAAAIPPGPDIPPLRPLPDVTLVAPQNIHVTNTSPNSLTVTWTPPTNPIGIRSYDIFRDGHHIGTVDASAPHVFVDTDPQLLPHTNYAYTVKGNVLSNPSNHAIGSTEYLAAPPPTPNLSLSTVTANSVTLFVTPLIDVARYNIYRRTPTTAMTLLDTTTSFIYTDRTVSPGQTYLYAVTAVNSLGEASSHSNTVTATVPM